MGTATLSKSTWIEGQQCSKLLWHRIHSPNAFPPEGAANKARKSQGTLVGQIAQRRFPNGIQVGTDGPSADPVEATRDALKRRVPLFEAAFAWLDAVVCVDILVPAARGQWDLVEVKSGTEIEQIHQEDAAFQYAVVTGSGLPIRRVTLMHLDRDYVRDGDLNPDALFKEVDVTEFAQTRRRAITDGLSDLLRTAREATCPEVPIGPHCDDPRECPLKDTCWAFLPPRHVLTLSRDRGRTRGFDLVRRGILDLARIPENYRLTSNQQIQRRSAIENRPHLDRDSIQAFLGKMEYPLSFLDFETFQTAVPPFDGLHPWAQVPFQFSLQTQATPSGPVRHTAFLAEGASDPRRSFLADLKKVVPEAGSIVVYNAAFERGILTACGDAFPAERAWIRNAQRRLVDLLDPFGKFHFHHPDQLGSASIKKVLPVLTGTNYNDLAIRDGATAASEFYRVTYTQEPPRNGAKIRAQLLRYCERDTQAMIDVLEALKKLAR